jgi:hypothetical protein
MVGMSSSNTSTLVSGGCRCGAVRFTATAAPRMVRMCWCRDCQYFASGNGTLNLAFDTAALQLSGTLTDYASQADSGNRMHRGFCPVCGVQVTSQAEARPHLVIVRAGTLDDPSQASPLGHIWTRSAPAWARWDESLPCFEGQPPPGAAVELPRS